jgi:anti-sigma factor RsiW
MRKHCTMAELVAIRDGEGSEWAREHLNECPTCRHELDLVHRRVAALRALGARRAPRDRWPEVRAAAERERRALRARRMRWGALAIAAGVVLALGARTVLTSGRTSDDHGTTPTAELATLMTQSQQLEAALRSYGPDGRVLNARAAGVIADLEDRIALVDAGIAQENVRDGATSDLVGLWRNRVELMGALVNAHVTRVSYVGF